jgi:tetratricopeptide (TPR) repeat protein
LVDEIEDLAAQSQMDTKPQIASLFADKVKEAESALHRAQQLFPDDAEFAQVEARLRSRLNEDERAVTALEKAWKARPRGAGVAVRLSISYASRGDKTRAISTLEEALERNPDDRQARHELAKLLLAMDPLVEDVVEGHLSRSFGKNDNNFEARYLYGQFLFYRRRMPAAEAVFQELDRAAPPDFRSSPPLGPTLVTALLPRFEGRIIRKEETYLFLQSSVYQSRLYSRESWSPYLNWDLISTGANVTFCVAFTRQGPIARDLHAGKLNSQ